jgi:hypothetical protein
MLGLVRSWFRKPPKREPEEPLLPYYSRCGVCGKHERTQDLRMWRHKTACWHCWMRLTGGAK